MDIHDHASGFTQNNKLEQYREIMEFIPSAIVVFALDQSGILQKLYSNEAAKRLAGTQDRNLVAQSELLGVVYPPDREKIAHVIESYTKEKKDWTWNIV